MSYPLAVAAGDITAQALTRLVTGTALAPAVVAVGNETAAMPAPEQVVGRLETLAS